MKLTGGRAYRVREFAELAGVTIRALRHYDRLGLLKPSQRSDSGYRLYTDRDLIRLEQIVVLKYLGLPLRDIGKLLRRGSTLADTLRRQEAVLGQKREQLGRAIQAIGSAARALGTSGDPDWQLFTRIIKEIEMQQHTDWSKRYYSPEAQARVEERKKLWSPELQARVSQEWAELVGDIEFAIAAGEPPQGAKAQALAARWRELVAGFTGGDPEIQRGLNKMWADKANWPAAERERFTIPRTRADIHHGRHEGRLIPAKQVAGAAVLFEHMRERCRMNAERETRARSRPA